MSTKRSKKKRPDRTRSGTKHEFISDTEVEERYFPNAASRRRDDHKPIEVETRQRVEDALADLGSGS